ncbi:MAG: protein kinase domain-containing protein, partial [Gemmatimonadales bacterium]
DYAHRHGVIHRDIKPENILLHDGSALVADFGIALAVSQAGGTRMTETGLSLGTPHYMSPEQAMGEREITARSDVYALGCVTYEMLTGEPPFTGPTVQTIIAKMMTERPIPPSKVRDTVPEPVEEAVLTALAKLPADRWRSAAEFAAALGGREDRRTGARPRSRDATSLPHFSTSTRFTRALIAALAATAALAAWSWWRPGSPENSAVIRFELQPTTGTQVAFPISGVATYLALSPDGRQAVYAAKHGGSGWTLQIRSLDQLNSRELPGTEGGAFPEFSPDGRWIAFGAADGSLKKIALDGSALTTLSPLDASGVSGITWTSDREIVFAWTNSAARGLWRVPSDGGQPVAFTQFDSASGERLQLSPRSADHGRLLFYSSTKASNLDLTMGVIVTASGKPKVLTGLRGARALGLADGFLLYVRGDGALMAAPFDTRTLRAGPPLQILDSIAARAWMAPAALSASGSLLYQLGGLASQLMTVDQHGVARALIDSAQAYAHPRLSPDGHRLAFEVQGGTRSEIWIADLAAHTAERLTRDGFSDRPEWTPDGGRVMYTSTRTTSNSLWWQPADGSGAAEVLYQAPDAIREAAFAPNGQAVVYRADSPNNNRDIYLLPLAGERKPVPLLVTVDDDKQPRVSPDSKWLAYVSNQSGREEVYVRGLASAASRVPVSTGGGGEPLWSPDGRRVFYRAGATLMAATIATSPVLAVTSREALFEGPYATDPYHPNYDVTPDGKSFIMVRPVEQNRRLVMVVNWTRELSQRTGGSK